MAKHFQKNISRYFLKAKKHLGQQTKFKNATEITKMGWCFFNIPT